MDLLFFQLFGFLDILLLVIIYFSKKRINNYENKIYKYLLLINFIGQFLHICCFLSIANAHTFPILNEVITKLYLVYLIVWLLLIVVYIILISNLDSGYNDIRKKKIFKKIMSFFWLMLVLSMIIIILLPIHHNFDVRGIYTYGSSVNFVYLASGIYIFICLIVMLLNTKKLKSKKYIPIFSFIFLGTLVMLIQKYNPQLLLITSTETFITLMMYFTIENPDMLMIEQLNLARDQAEKANNAKTDFLSNMSHEIRTPLNAIVGFSQALSEEDIPTSAKEEVEDIIMASRNLLEIVNGILDISKIEANKLEIINSEYQLSRILDELVVLTKARLGDKPITLQTTFDKSIPPVLYGDHSRLKQIVLNLLTNAVKYTKEGRIVFKVDYVLKKDICRLIISVEDTGMGIKPQHIDKLFNKFDRLDMEHNTTIEGTGLGLAITKKLVELMHGQIVVHSIYGEGSKFTVAIDQRIVKTPTILEKEKANDELLDATGKRILVVDDNPINIKVATRLLQTYHFTIDTVLSGQECIDKIKNQEQYDIILLDDMMPKMSGVETLKHLKEIEHFDTPVIVFTANAISGMREKYLNDGFDDYLSKPIERPELNAALKKFLTDKEE